MDVEKEEDEEIVEENEEENVATVVETEEVEIEMIIETTMNTRIRDIKPKTMREDMTESENIMIMKKVDTAVAVEVDKMIRGVVGTTIELIEAVGNVEVATIKVKRSPIIRKMETVK